MTRDLDIAVSDAVASNAFAWVLLLKLELDSETVYVHTGVGDLSWDGQTWLGVGSMANIAGFTESIDGGDNRITVALSGIPIEVLPDFIDEFTTQDTAGRAWTLYVAALDSDGEVDGEASLLNSGQTGAVDMVDGESPTVSISLVTEAALMRGVLFYRFTDEDQQSLFAGDLFCEFASDVGDDIAWGATDPVQLVGGSAGSGSGARDIRE